MNQRRTRIIWWGSVITAVAIVLWGTFTVFWLLGLFIKTTSGGDTIPNGATLPDASPDEITFILIPWIPILLSALIIRLLRVRWWNPDFRVQQQRRTRVQLIETMSPEYITPEFIAEEANVEVRNALIRKLGMDKYLKMVSATKTATDDWGELYSYRPRNTGLREPSYAAVKVLNGTKEPDGTFKEYWLRVPGEGSRQPESFCQVCGRNISARPPTTPKEAIAWTFSLCAHHYNPQLVS